MTVELQATEVAAKLEAALPGCTVESNGNIVVIKDEFVLKAAEFLKNTARA